MIYLRNAIVYSTFYDHATKTKILRDEIVKVEHLSEKMKKRIRRKGLIECTEKEYNAYLEKVGKIEAAPKDAVASAADDEGDEAKQEEQKLSEEPREDEEGKSSEEPKEPEKMDAVDSSSGVITSSPRPSPRPRLRRK